MKLLSLNVGTPGEITRDGEAILSAIFKSPIDGPVTVRTLNIDGDRQADLSVHGGPNKAVYAYPSEHYPFWHLKYPRMTLPWGAFGENLTTVGLDESSVHLGDRFRIGSAILQVSQPRMPCFKLAAKFNDDAIIYSFLESGRSGFYFSVHQEGSLQAGDAIEVDYRDPAAFSISEALKLYIPGAPDRALLERALSTPALIAGLRRRAQDQLSRL